jgi:hypothetical protein
MERKITKEEDLRYLIKSIKEHIKDNDKYFCLIVCEKENHLKDLIVARKFSERDIDNFKESNREVYKIS